MVHVLYRTDIKPLSDRSAYIPTSNRYLSDIGMLTENRHTDYTEDDAHDASAQRPHLTQQQEVDLESRVQQTQDDFTGEAQRPPGDAVVADEVVQLCDEITGEAQQPPGNAFVGDELQQSGDELTGEAQRPPGVAVMEDGQDIIELAAQRPQNVNDVVPRRSSRQKNRPQFLKDYLLEDDDIFYQLFDNDIDWTT